MPEGDKTKLKVVIDTNVFVSGLDFQGNPREILDLIWQGEIEAYISPFILQELEKSLAEDFDWKDKEIKKVVEKIRRKPSKLYPIPPYLL